MSSNSTILPTSLPNSEQEQYKKGTKGFRKALLDGGGLAYLFPQNINYLLRSLVLYFIEQLALLLRFVPMLCYPKLFYSIVDEIISSTTRVVFTRRKRNKQPVCLKLWQFENICNAKLVTRNIDYLLEGLEFNRRFAPSAYLGIAPVYIKGNEDPKKILRGKLMEKPKKSNLKYGVEYALVMRRLDEELRLDHQIYHRKLGTKVDFEFLAKEVAQMHRHLDNSPKDKGNPASISSKLELNR